MKNILTISFLLTCSCCFGQNSLNTKTFETDCDSIYIGKGYKITQLYFSEGIDTISDNNTVFQLLKTGPNPKVIYQDTIYSRNGDIEFKDYNGDSVKDILIQNISDVRSNWTYYLYLVDSVQDKVQKIKGFEEIKNPNYLPQYNLIDNYVNSGRNWTSFYEITHGHIKDFDIVIYDDMTENSTYSKEYKKAIQTILKRKKVNR